MTPEPELEQPIIEETPIQQPVEPEVLPTDPPTQDTPAPEPQQPVIEETPIEQPVEQETIPSDPQPAQVTPEPELEQPITEETPVASEEPATEVLTEVTVEPTLEAETPQPVITEETPAPTLSAESEALVVEEAGDPAQLPLACEMLITDSGDANPFTFSFAAINIQGYTNFDWVLGDGDTATGPNVTHTYSPLVGTYPVTLNCRIDGINDAALAATISTTPTAVAAFTVNPLSVGFSPFSISLENNSTGDGLGYLWQVSGPEFHADINAANPGYVFATPGIYTITLTITDTYGYSAMTQQTITVVESATTCDFTGNLTAMNGDTSTYVSNVTNLLGRTANYTWTITGPNTHVTYTTQDISHTWGDMGLYQIALTISAVDTNTGNTTDCESVVKNVQVEAAEGVFMGSLTCNPLTFLRYTSHGTARNIHP